MVPTTSHNPLEPDQPTVGRYFPALDGVRALAVTYVFFHHYLAGGRILPSFLSWGWSGVQVFFVLSGFLITGILWDSRDDAHRLRNFYGRRVVRILPLYYGVWAALFLSWPIFHWVWSPAYLLWVMHLGNFVRFLPWRNLADPRYLDHLHSAAGDTVFTGHLWSLCVEEQFYLVWPWLIYKLPTRKSVARLCAALVITLPFVRAVCTLLLHPHYTAFLELEPFYRLTPFQADGFAWGGLLAMAIRGPAAAKLQRWSRTLLALAAVSVALMVLLSRATTGNWIGATNRAVIATVGFSALDAVGFALILYLLKESTPLGKLFTLPPVRRLGVVSYGFYVLHFLPKTFYWKVSSHFSTHVGVVAAVLGFICTYLLAELSFRFYETPFLKLKRKFVAA